MKIYYLLVPLCVAMSGCTTAFEIGEGLNRLTANAASNPKYFWDIVPPAASTPAATSEPKVETK